MANQVTLTFAGDESRLTQSFANVGQASNMMADQSVAASRRMAEGFDYASSQSSMLSGGIGDVGGALTAAFGEESGLGQLGAEMERYGTIIMGVTGIMDLALFATNNLKIGTLAKAAADKTAAAAHWLLNTAMLASPITWIIVGIVALIAIIVLIARRTDWFSKAWRTSWGWVKNAAANAWDYMKKIPGWISSAFGRVADFISRPYRAAFNMIARAWNSTVGRLSWTVPAWVPIIGGNSISVPNLPQFHAGGIVPGVPGTPTVALLQAGERVTGVAGAGRDDGAWQPINLGDLGDILLPIIARAVNRRGGGMAQLGVKVAR